MQSSRTLIALVALLLASCMHSGPPMATATGSVSSQTATLVDACHVEIASAGSTHLETLCALNPDVSQVTIATTICVAGWTATIRPPSTYTSALKVQQISDEHLSDTNPSDYEEDHRMPLELGGAPRDVTNLSPEPHSSSSTKDSDENTFKRDVCAGVRSLQAAQIEFATKWLAAYPAYRQ